MSFQYIRIPLVYEFIAFVLLAAAILKAFAPGDTHPLALAIYVSLEAGLGMYLVFFGSKWPLISRRIVLFVFSSFAGYSLISMLRGEPCKCFGEIEIPAGVILLFDIGAVVATQISLPDKGQTLSSISKKRMCAFTICSFMLLVPLAAHAYHPRESNALNRAASRIGIEFLRPNQWVGQHFPLLGSTDLTQELSFGSWTIVLYRPDCSRCQELLKKITEIDSKGERLAVISLESEKLPVSLPQHVLHGVNRSQKIQLMTTPAIVRMRDSLVTNVYQSNESVTAFVDSFQPTNPHGNVR